MNNMDQSGGFGDLFSEIPVFAQVFIAGVMVLFVLIVVFVVISSVKNWRALKKAGVDPLAAQGQLAGQLANSELLAGKQSTEDRLREIDDLHARGVISDEEHQAARAAALTDS
jgi:uncharacterized transporter YbjL